MKRTAQHPPAAQASRFDLSIDAETLDELRELIEQRRKLDDAVNSAPAEIAAAESELAEMRQRLSVLEADVVLVDEDRLAALQNEIESLASAIDAKDIAVRRLRGRLDALESRAPDLDSRIEIAIGYVRIEVNLAAGNLQSQLAEELRQNVANVRKLYSQVRALRSVVPLQQAKDFLVCAHVPDLERCMVSFAGGIPHDISQNLLALDDDSTAAAEAEIAEALQPVTEALMVARQHRPYVPLAKRPPPSIRKGAWDGPGGRTGDRPERPSGAGVHKDGAGNTPAESGTERESGNRAGMPAEINMAVAIDAAARSSEW